MEQQTSRTEQGGLLSGLSSLGRNMFGLMMSRVELAALELAEIRIHLLKLAVLAALGVIVAWFAIGYWTALIVYLSWPTLGWKILLIIALVATAITVGILFYMLSLLKLGKLSMPATMEELRKDRDALLKEDTE
jgi:uncharacterized membrane protein YqjE